jgi:hypothetical protein
MDRPPQAIAKGQLFASQLLDGDTDSLAEHSIGDAATQLKTLPNFNGIVPWAAMKDAGTPPLHHHLWTPVKVAMREDRRQPYARLKAFDVTPGIYVMTFVGLAETYSDSPVMRDGAPMLASVMVRHVVERKDTWLTTLGRKVANAFWLPGTWGERGRWVLVDYSLTFNRRDYFEWVKANGERLHRESEERSAEVLRDIRKFVENAQSSVQPTLEQSHLDAFGLMRMQQQKVTTLLD